MSKASLRDTRARPVSNKLIQQQHKLRLSYCKYDPYLERDEKKAARPGNQEPQSASGGNFADMRDAIPSAPTTFLLSIPRYPLRVLQGVLKINSSLDPLKPGRLPGSIIKIMRPRTA